MEARQTPLMKLMQNPMQFVIPIYQRTYSWTRSQCSQLWEDVLRASAESIQGHFIGSIVYIHEGLYEVSSIQKVQVIDGQQRLVTLSLMLSALGKVMKETDANNKKDWRKINNYYLFNAEEEDEKRFKLILTRSDKETFFNIIQDREVPLEHSRQIKDNYDFFLEKIRSSSLSPDRIFHGISKLIAVSIALDRKSDDPQLIFESLNSTGLRLSQTDLIRNFVLMDLEPGEQKDIYENFWHPIEERFDSIEKKDDFDDFVRDFLTVKTGIIPVMRQIYEDFKRFRSEFHETPIQEMMNEIKRYSVYYTKLLSANFEDSVVSKTVRDINKLEMYVAYPFLLEVLEDHSKEKISNAELIKIMKLAESYVFRRAICDIPTNSLNKTFANLTKSVDKEHYLESLEATFVNKEGYTRFPTDEEFKREFVEKNVYQFKRRGYLLGKLENFEHKEPISTDEYTVEHIMPRNENLSAEWKAELGEDWKRIRDKYIHMAPRISS